MESIHCLFCGDAGTRPYHQENGYQAVSCNACGLVFVTPRPSEAEMKQLYEGQETKIDLGRQIRKIEAATVEAQTALRLIRRHAPAGRILEIGCAAGWFLREASRKGHPATGIDITRQLVTFARDVLGVDAREGTLTSVPLDPGTFDVVYHRNVLSHLAYPLESFHRMRELLRPEGLVVFQTGNVAELPGEHWAGTDELDLPDHLFHFSEPTIRLLLDRTGFETLEVRRYALVAHDPWLRALTRPRRPSPSSSASSAPREPSPTQPTPFVPPNHAPRPRIFKMVEALADQALTFGLGSIVPARGRRCTLIVVGRARR